jgi:hypothetical protein
MSMSNGFADVGVFGVPWAIVGAMSLLASATWLSLQVMSRRSNRKRALFPAATRIVWAAWLAGMLVVGAAANSPYEPMTTGLTSGPIFGLTLASHDGTIRTGNSTSYTITTNAPRYIARVAPGQAFAMYVSIRNTGPLSITIEGWERNPNEDSAAGVRSLVTSLGSLPGFIEPENATAADVRPFAPMPVATGSSVTFVIQFAGGPCADPAAPDPGSNQTRFETHPVVYDVLGWRRTGDLWFPFEVTVPGDPHCLP